MRRGLWFAAGAGAGLYAAVRGRRAAEAFTPEGLRMRWQVLGLGARLFGEEIASGKAEAEVRLRERLSPARLDTPALVPRTDGATHQLLPTQETQEGTQ